MLDRVRLMEASRAERIEHAATEVLDLAKRGADSQREIMTTVRAMLQVMARAYVTMLARGETCNFYLDRLRRQHALDQGHVVVGPNGRITCASLPLGARPRYVGTDRTIARRSGPANSSSATI